jgi:hypothetical protein
MHKPCFIDALFLSLRSLSHLHFYERASRSISSSLAVPESTSLATHRKISIFRSSPIGKHSRAPNLITYREESG